MGTIEFYGQAEATMTTGARATRWLFIGLLLLLSGCGVKGDLFMPDTDAATTSETAEP